jgi:cytidine deaminase
MKEKEDASRCRELVAAAAQARLAAYAPYSRFRVGAALEMSDGRIFTGCNIENASFGATNCAERTAIGKAVSEGGRRIKRIAVVGDREEPCLPCGICRQVLAEFADPGFVLLAGAPSGEYKVFHMDDLLPNAFALPVDPEE